MVDDFSFGIYVPSLSRELTFKELLNKHYKTIIKYIQNEDSDRLCTYFDYLINELTYDDSEFHLLDRVDKFIIILSLRVLCVGSALETVCTCPTTNKEYKGNVDLIGILDKVVNLNAYKGRSIKIDDTFEVTLGFPRDLTYKTAESMTSECISTISINDKTFYLSKFTKSERDDLLTQMPITFLGKVYNFMKEKYKIFNEITYLTIQSPYDTTIPATKLTFNLFNNTFLEFLEFIFGKSLNDYYDIMYILITKLNMQGEHIESCQTPAESLLYIKKYEKELAQQAKAHDSQQTSQQSADMPMSVPFNGLDM